MSEIIFPVESLVQYGLLGVVLGWFMWRNEKVLNKLVDKITELCIKLDHE